MLKLKLYTTLILGLFCILSTNAKLKNLDLITDSATFSNQDNLYSNIILIDNRPEIEKKNIKIDEKVENEKLNSLLTNANNDKTLLIQINKLYLLTENGKNHYHIQARAYEITTIKSGRSSGSTL